MVLLYWWDFVFLFRKTHDAGDEKNAYYRADEGE